ncbi:hypothetical protein CSUI_007721 [Cystoisospora suis]|uniref:Uncharacterized protein n=1 Tax=Cystoisospora suis TaxID=483139 RepID=A0A2C6KPL2_9APIC|nr:hypothetical protein CSUI_007721 [Cystoisospora suis]
MAASCDTHTRRPDSQNISKWYLLRTLVESRYGWRTECEEGFLQVSDQIGRRIPTKTHRCPHACQTTRRSLTAINHGHRSSLTDSRPVISNRTTTAQRRGRSTGLHMQIRGRNGKAQRTTTWEKQRSSRCACEKRRPCTLPVIHRTTRRNVRSFLLSWGRRKQKLSTGCARESSRIPGGVEKLRRHPVDLSGNF